MRPVGINSPLIKTIGIPTRNRTKSLRRCITSFHANAREAGRTLNFSVIDRSDKTNSEANKSLIYSLSTQDAIAIQYFDYTAIKQAATVLSKVTGVDENLTQFALLGNPQCPLSYGASRNVLLLQSVGHRSLQTDDDTVCQTAHSDYHRKGLSISSQRNPFRYKYFSDSKQALSSVKPAKLDLLSLHESLLGRFVTDVIGETLNEEIEIDFSDSNSNTINYLLHTNASIISTLPGTVGDAGNQNYAFRLLESPQVMEEAGHSNEAFQHLITTRWTFKGVHQTTLLSGANCMSTQIGLDTSRLLPPFMPVMRNEDGVWGCVQNTCFPHRFSAYLPYTVQHLPPEFRAAPSFANALCSPGMRTNDLLSQLILYARPASGQALTMPDLGRHLGEISALPHEAFKKKIQETAIQTCTNLMEYAQHALGTHTNAPERWKYGVSAYITSLEHLREAVIPLDLHGSQHDKWTLFQNLVSQYGLLLIHWETLTGAAAAYPLFPN